MCHWLVTQSHFIKLDRTNMFLQENVFNLLNLTACVQSKNVSLCKRKKKRPKKSFVMSKVGTLFKCTLITKLVFSQRKLAVDSHRKAQVWACGTLAQLQSVSSLSASWQDFSVCVVLAGMSWLERTGGGTRPPWDLAELTKWTRSITLDGTVTVSQGSAARRRVSGRNSPQRG